MFSSYAWCWVQLSGSRSQDHLFSFQVKDYVVYSFGLFDVHFYIPVFTAQWKRQQKTDCKVVHLPTPKWITRSFFSSWNCVLCWRHYFDDHTHLHWSQSRPMPSVALKRQQDGLILGNIQIILNHRVAWVRRGLKVHEVSSLVLHAWLPTRSITRSGCPGPYPTWSLLATCASVSAPCEWKSSPQHLS